jgi:DNA gyrase subunit A
MPESDRRRQRRRSVQDEPDPEVGTDDGGSADLEDVTTGSEGPRTDRIQLQDEIEKSFLEYAMSVIVGRALPDVRDGLKVVQRRILYGMYEQRLLPDRTFKKCARVVGDVMGKYHPHGDQAIYDALVRMAQDFSLRYPLVQGHGNFGSPDFGAAAMRYTECRLARLSEAMLDGIDEDTVDFIPNYDGEEREPTVMPARFPNLLVNGSEGIAVAVATSIPPHNMSEVCEAAIYYIDHPEASPDELAEIVKGPDFPTGGLIMGTDGIRDAYRSGKGSVVLRARTDIEQTKKGRSRIVVTELPYQAKPGQILDKIKSLVDTKVIEGISDLRDETSRDGTRLVIELRPDADELVVRNLLFKHTDLERRFNINMVAVVGQTPRTLNLAEMIGYYIDHQIEVVERRTKYRLQRARERKHIVEGLLIAVSNIDAVIALIRQSEDSEAARNALMERFSLSEIQAREVLDMPLRRLTKLDAKRLQDEDEELSRMIREFERILADPKKLREVIKKELAEVKEKFGDSRKTEISGEESRFDLESLVADEEIVVTVTRNDYVKAARASNYKRQARGGRGISGGKVTEDDVAEHIIRTTRHAYLLFFTNRGRVFRLRALELPIKERTARGEHIRKYLKLEEEDPDTGRPAENIQAVIDTSQYETKRYLVIATKKGVVKKTNFNAYDSAGRRGIIAVDLQQGDEVVAVLATSAGDEILLVTGNGMSLRFHEKQLRAQGRATRGVRGINLKAGDYVVAAVTAADDEEILVVTTRGYGKRTPVGQFRLQSRGGKGVRAIRLAEAKGKVAGALAVSPGDEIFVVSTDGNVIRVPISDISRQSRDATGVRIMKLELSQEVAGLTLADREEDTGS